MVGNHWFTPLCGAKIVFAWELILKDSLVFISITVLSKHYDNQRLSQMTEYAGTTTLTQFKTGPVPSHPTWGRATLAPWHPSRCSTWHWAWRWRGWCWGRCQGRQSRTRCCCWCPPPPPAPAGRYCAGTLKDKIFLACCFIYALTGWCTAAQRDFFVPQKEPKLWRGWN